MKKSYIGMVGVTLVMTTAQALGSEAAQQTRVAWLATCPSDPPIDPQATGRLQSADKAVQLGVVSFGDGCGKAKTPGVYTAVANHLAWISESRKSKSCTPKDVAENRC